jgi:class 3 adenylate cyclase/predicted ATPase
MTDIRQWLTDLRLEKYADLFEREEVGVANLATLTDAELKELGLPLGPRKTILAAAAKLKGPLDSSSSDSATRDEPSAADRSSEGPQAERRQLTVMFCDLVGSTELSQKLDPEVLRRLIRQYQDACVGSVARYEGHVAQFLGDGVLAYFGYPLAHEGEAERAIRAGLDIVERVDELSTDHKLQVRIGIDSGLVVIGQGEALSEQERTAIGDAPNVAARLQSLAKPGSVVISGRARQLSGGAFDYADLGRHELKGIDQPLQAWRVTGEKVVETRFDASTGGKTAPMVGREMELSVALQAWEQAKSGKQRVLLLCGEPGIGKSRILRAIREQLSQDRAQAWQYQCSPFFANTALYPVIANIERASGFDRNDSSELRLVKLEGLLKDRFGCSDLDLNLIGRLFDLPVEEKYGSLAMTPQKQKDETIRALADVAHGASEQQPLLFLFEDVHWSDPTTIEMLDHWLTRKDMKTLVVITYRPEFKPPWSGQSQVTQLMLSRLDAEQIEKVATRVADGKKLPKEIVEQIVQKTDGVPLFVEELTKAILETDIVSERKNEYVLNGPLTTLAIPATLHDSLMARLDRLAPTKEAAQIGACIGREFSHELLALVSTQTKEQLDDAVGQLLASELVFQRGEAENTAYAFKHALVQDAAYESLLKSKRAEIHAKIAHVLEERFLHTKDTEPELLAHHYTEAGLIEQAAPLWQKAGERALDRTALREALSHLETALGLIVQLPKSDSTDRFELDVRLTLGSAYFAFHGWQAVEVKEVLEPARVLARRLSDDEKLVPISYYIWFHHGMRCEYPETVAAAEEIQRVALKTKDSNARVTGSMTRACAHVWQGEFEQARALGDDVLAVYDYEQHRGLAPVYNHDVKCLTLVWAGAWHWILGYPEKARVACIEQMEHARKVGHPFNLLWGLSGGSIGLLFRRETDLLVDWLKEIRVIGRDLGMPVADLLSSWWGGYALIEQGRYSEGFEQLSPGAEHWRQTGGLHLIPYVNLMRARALAHMNDLSKAKVLIDDAINVVNRTGHRMHEAEVYRIRGEITLLGEPQTSEEAERDFLNSLQIATEQQAKGWELRSSTSLARLWQSQGKFKEAHDLLKPVYNWFTEGFDTKDLKEAKALLEELRVAA